MKGFDSYFNVPLGMDIQNVSDEVINFQLQNLSRNRSNSMLLKKSIQFFIEYYNKSIFKLKSMSYDDLFVPSLLKDNNGNDIPSKEKEMELSLEKLRIEFNNFLNKYQLNINNLIDTNDKDRFNKLFNEFFKDRCLDIIGNNQLVSSVLISLSNILYNYVFIKNKGNNDVNVKNALYKAINNYDASILAKYNRMINLEAKLAHTSRMVFMTIYNTKDIKDQKLRELVVLSVMFHDIGRIYQALYYPNFNDSFVKRGEVFGNSSVLRSHAEVGYYFPMLNLIVQDLIRCNGNVDETFVMHTLMSVVIKYHGRSNAEISHYDEIYGDVSLDYKTITDLEKLLLEIFKKSPKIPVESRFDTLSNINHMQEFHKDIAKYVIDCIILISKVKRNESSLDSYVISKAYNLEKQLEKYYPVDILEDLYNHPEKLENATVLEKLFGIVPPKTFKINSSKLEDSIEERLEKLNDSILAVDFATTIDNIISDKDTDIVVDSNLLIKLKKIMGAIMTITTDMDKIDIFNQRINGSWEKTNTYIFNRNNNEGELTREEIIDDLTRATFFSNVGEEPTGSKVRPRGYQILYGESDANAVKSLWFHFDQFITVNMRNYTSLELFYKGNYLEKIRNHMIELQKDEYKDVIIPLIDEAITFLEHFLDFVLHVRVDNKGNYIYPIFNSETGKYSEVEGNKPVLFNANDMADMRKIVLLNYKEYYHYVGDKPLEGEYPVPSFINEVKSKNMI